MSILNTREEFDRSIALLLKCLAPRSFSGVPDHQIINFVNMAPGGEWKFHKGGKTANFKPVSRLHVNKADVAIAAAIDGRGITRLLSYMTAFQIKSGKLKIVLEDYEPPPIPVHIVHKEAGQTSARVRAVVDHLVQSLRNNPALN